MKKYLIYTIIALSVALMLSVWRCSDRAAEARRQSDNVETLTTEARAYKVCDSLNALSTGVLQFERDELRRARAKDAALIKDMNLRLARVNAIAKVSTEGKYEIKASLTPLDRQPFDRSLLNDSVFRVASAKAMASALDKTADQRLAAQRFALRTPYIDIDGTVGNDSLSATIVVRDTIVQVLHRVPRFKFLGIWFGTKGVRQEIVSKNPHTKITAAEYIEIKK